MNKAFTWLCSRSRTPLCDRTLTSCSKRCMRLASPAKVISAKPLPSKYAASFSQARVCTGFNLFYILSHYEDEMENVRVSSVKRETKIIWSNHTEDKKLFLFPIIFRKVNVYERFQDKRPHLPQGFSTVVLSLKIFSKLYRLSTSSLSVSNSIQPLKLGRASWGGGWKTKNKDNKDKEQDNMYHLNLHLNTRLSTSRCVLDVHEYSDSHHDWAHPCNKSTQSSVHLLWKYSGILPRRKRCRRSTGWAAPDLLQPSRRLWRFVWSPQGLLKTWTCCRTGGSCIQTHREEDINTHIFPWVFSPLRKVLSFCFPWFFSGNVCLQSVFRLFSCLMWNQVKRMETQIWWEKKLFYLFM